MLKHFSLFSSSSFSFTFLLFLLLHFFIRREKGQKFKFYPNLIQKMMFFFLFIFLFLAFFILFQEQGWMRNTTLLNRYIEILSFGLFLFLISGWKRLWKCLMYYIEEYYYLLLYFAVGAWLCCIFIYEKAHQEAKVE